MSKPTTAQIEQFAETLKALGHPTRLRIVAFLNVKEATVTTVYTTLDLPQAVASQHLLHLKDRGVLASRKVGTSVFYRIAQPVAATVAKLAADVTVA